MKRFLKSRSTARNSSTLKPAATVKPAPEGSKKRNSATVEGIRKKLAGYQKTQGPARFIQPQELTYLNNGSIEFDAPGALGDSTIGIAVPFSLCN